MLEAEKQDLNMFRSKYLNEQASFHRIIMGLSGSSKLPEDISSSDFVSKSTRVNSPAVTNYTDYNPG